MARTDILLDDNFDIIDDGEEWVEGDSDQQHVDLLLLLQKGEIKEFPHMGFGIEGRLNARYDAQSFLRPLEIELESDGYSPEIELGETIKDLKISI